MRKFLKSLLTPLRSPHTRKERAQSERENNNLLFLVVGLGNPGTRYVNTRHNVGFQVIERLLQTWNASSPVKKFHSEFALVSQAAPYPDGKVALLMPQTFMNRSGIAVSQAIAFYKIETSQKLLVILDDLDLAPGQLRIRKQGGSGGHKGLESIIECLGTDRFFRIRMGIGRPAHQSAESYVLSPIEASERELFESAVRRCVEAVHTILAEGIEPAMNRYNRREGPDEP